MIGGVKLRRNLLPGPERSVALARWALVAAEGAAIATAMKASTSQTVSQARGDVWRDAAHVERLAPPPYAGQFLCIIKYEDPHRSSRAGHRGLRARIPACQCVPADDENVQKHLETVTQHAHFSGRRMRPAHGNLNGAQPVMTRQIEKLRSKAEALNALLLEDHAAAFAPKGLETALCIDKRQTQNGAHNKIENDAGRLTKDGLTHGNQVAVQSAGADGHVVIRQRRK